MIENEKQTRHDHVLSVARAMMAAARTAPKGRGIDNLEILTVSGPELETLAARMDQISAQPDRSFFARDAANIRASEAVVLIGVRNAAMGLNCGFCGYAVCGDKPSPAPCAFNITDLGIACGSAVALAADNRIDSRIMFSAGVAAMETGLIEGCIAVFAIPLSCTSKSPFFDRVKTH